MTNAYLNSHDLFPSLGSPRVMPILPQMYSNFTQADTKTRSIDLARRILLELADSEARTKDGDVCVGKEEILKITNKRRLYDVTGPLEAMGLIETTKINIIWTGCRLGCFSFIGPGARNANVLGRNADELARFGRRQPAGPRAPDLPRPPPPRKHRGASSEARERVRFLLKRKQLLLSELREKESGKTGPPGICYADVCLGVSLVLQSRSQEQLCQTTPNLFIVSGEHQYQVLQSQPLSIKCNVDSLRLAERALYEFTSRNPLELHYIDNAQQATISPNLQHTSLRGEPNYASPPFNKGFFETPLMNELKYGEWEEQ